MKNLKNYSNANSPVDYEINIKDNACITRDLQKKINSTIALLYSKNYRLINANLTKIIYYANGNFWLDTNSSLQIISKKALFVMLSNNRFNVNKAIRVYNRNMINNETLEKIVIEPKENIKKSKEVNECISIIDQFKYPNNTLIGL